MITESSRADDTKAFPAVGAAHFLSADDTFDLERVESSGRVSDVTTADSIKTRIWIFILFQLLLFPPHMLL